MKAKTTSRSVMGGLLVALAAVPLSLAAFQDSSSSSPELNVQAALEQAQAAASGASPFSAPPPPAPDEVVMLQLRDGSIRWGAIEGHSPSSIDFRSLDTSGRAVVPWALLDPQQAEALRTDFGYVEVEVDEAYVVGDRLTLDGGGTVEGVIVSREGAFFEVKTNGTLQRVPKARVRGIEAGVQLAALDVYSREALYGIYLSETTVESAESQLALARKCESILDFVHAAEHYQTAIDAGLQTDVDAVQGMLARAKIKAENQEQVEYLREADRLRKRGQYDKGQEMLAIFDDAFPDSALLADARKQEVKLLKARDEAAKKLVKRRWIYWAKTLTRKKSIENSFEAASTWITENASEEIQARVFEDVTARVTTAIELDDVRKLWEERKKLRYSPASYRPDGTWLLGPEAAQRGLVEEEEEEAEGPVSEVDAQRLAIEQRIKRYMQNQRIARRSRGAEEETDEFQTFWQTWSQGARAGWLLAYYIEESGDFEIRPRPDLRACKTCAGKGAIELLVTGTARGEQTDGVAPCPLCHGVQYSRRIYYR